MSRWKKPQKDARQSMNEVRQQQEEAKAKLLQALAPTPLMPTPLTPLLDNANWYDTPPIPFSGLIPNPVTWLGPQWVPTAISSLPPPSAVDPTKLEALKNAEPHRVMKRMPDLVEVITGWRAWKVNGERLGSLGQTHTWEPKKQMEATCAGGFSMHRAPGFNCQCGIWAFKDLDRLVQAVGSYQNIQVLGTVSLWGRVIETENGWRAEKAYPAELWLFDSDLEELGLVYDVPVRTI